MKTKWNGEIERAIVRVRTLVVVIAVGWNSNQDFDGSGGGPVVWQTDPADGRHASISNEVLQQTGEDQLFILQDHMTQFFWMSNEQIVCIQGRSMETTVGSAWRMKELEESLVKFIE